MNSCDTGASAIPTSAPLFASSWMALFLTIRDQFDGGQERDPCPAPEERDDEDS